MAHSSIHWLAFLGAAQAVCGFALGVASCLRKEGQPEGGSLQMKSYLTEAIGTFFLRANDRIDGGGRHSVRAASHRLCVDGHGLHGRPHLGRALQPSRQSGGYWEGSLTNIWIYIVFPLLGGAAASAVFKIQNPEDR
jgi:hypothetical protein